MKIDSATVARLTDEAQKELIERLLKHIMDNLDDLFDESGIGQQLLSDLLASMDLLDEEDAFGTEGWRHRILGED